LSRLAGCSARLSCDLAQWGVKEWGRKALDFLDEHVRQLRRNVIRQAVRAATVRFLTLPFVLGHSGVTGLPEEPLRRAVEAYVECCRILERHCDTAGADGERAVRQRAAGTP
jgi:hypothetical protein